LHAVYVGKPLDFEQPERLGDRALMKL